MISNAQQRSEIDKDHRMCFKHCYFTINHPATICLTCVVALEGNADDEGVLGVYGKSSTVSWAGADKTIYLYVRALELSHQTCTEVAYSGLMCRLFAGLACRMGLSVAAL